jgi:hypothetical protein
MHLFELLSQYVVALIRHLHLFKLTGQHVVALIRHLHLFRLLGQFIVSGYEGFRIDVIRRGLQKRRVSGEEAETVPLARQKYWQIRKTSVKNPRYLRSVTTRPEDYKNLRQVKNGSKF